MRSKKYKYKVRFLPDPICWTQVPEGLNILSHQRRRWQIGLIDVLKRYKGMFFNPRYGILGIVAMPYYFLFEMVSPFVELIGYLMIPVCWYFGLFSLDGLVLFFLAAVAFGVIASMGSLLVEEFTNTKFINIRAVLLLSFLSIAENMFYRQMTVFFRLMGILSYKRNKHAWGVMKRKKFN